MANVNAEEFRNSTNISAERINELTFDQLVEATSKIAAIIANEGENTEKLQQILELD